MEAEDTQSVRASRKSGRGLSPEMITALSAVIVGVCAILVSLYQAELMRNQQAAAVWPYVNIGMSSNMYGEPPELMFLAANSGVGPAIVRWAELRLDGEPVTTWEGLSATLTDAETAARPRQIQTLNGRVIKAGEHIIVFQPRDRALIEALFAASAERVDVLVCYCSIQDECWTTSFREWRTTTPVRHCPAVDANTLTQ